MVGPVCMLIGLPGMAWTPGVGAILVHPDGDRTLHPGQIQISILPFPGQDHWNLIPGMPMLSGSTLMEVRVLDQYHKPMEKTLG